jgi:hypothetical protein
MMLESLGQVSRKRSLYASLCMGYLVSFVVPRLGEVTRALIIKRTDGVKIERTIISLIAERLLDVVMLFILFIIALVGYHRQLNNFLNQIDLGSLMNQRNWFWIILIGAIIFLVFMTILFTSIQLRMRIIGLVRNTIPALRNLWHGMFSIRFLLYTIGIWLCYFLMTYLWFSLFDSTSFLTWKDAFIVMVIGSFGRSIPIQGGGMGAYHFLVSRMLFLLGLNLITGNALAIVIHGAQAVFTFFTGSLAYLWMLYDIRIHDRKADIAVV